MRLHSVTAHALVAMLALAAPSAHAIAGADEAPAAGTVTEVKVERERPMKDKHPTLRFLHENKDFIRARYDRLRTELVTREGEAGPIDPRFLAYQQLLAAASASRDSAAAGEEERRRHELFASITELGQLESELDLMDRQLAAQRDRLAALQQDFTGRQRTALVVVVSGWSAAAAPGAITVGLEQLEPVTVTLDAAQRATLERGGVVEIFHGFVEPREQVVAVTLAGTSWPGASPGFVTLEPERDRILMLRLDLSKVSPEGGAPTIQAAAWQHDTRVPSSDG